MTDVRSNRIPLLWGKVNERALAKGSSFSIGDAECLCVNRRAKLYERGVHSLKIESYTGEE